MALLSPSTLEYIVTIFALVRMRCTVLLLSTRLATEAYVNLLDKTNCVGLIHSESAAPSVEEIEKARQIAIYKLPDRSTLEATRSAGRLDLAPESEEAAERTCFIIHSSGSTGLPKPIFQSNSACLVNYANGHGYSAFLTLPLFHNHGLATFFRSLYSGTPVTLVNASLPITASSLMAAVDVCKPQSFHGVPYALKLIAESDRGVDMLAQCKIVMFGGSSCPDDLGDKLVNAGVYLIAHYGATEIGQLMTSYRPTGDKAWNYVRPSEAAKPYIHFSPRGDNMFECCVLDG